MKKIIFFSLLIILAFSFAPHNFASAQEGFKALAPINGLTSEDVTSVVNSGDFATFFNNLYRFLIGLAAVLAVVMIIWGGLEYATQDVPGAKQNGKDRIQQAIFGLVLVLSPVLVFSIINPSILNLSLNIEPIKPGNIVTDTSPNNAVVDPATKCIVDGIKGVYQTAKCPTANAAATWSSSVGCSSLLSSIECSLKNSSECTQTLATCGNKTNGLILVNIGASSALVDDYIFRPLGAKPDTVREFTEFSSKCNSAGGRLCSDGVKTEVGTNCNEYGGYTTNLGSDVSGICYTTPLYCISGARADEANTYFKGNFRKLTTEFGGVLKYIGSAAKRTNLLTCQPSVTFDSNPLN